MCDKNRIWQNGTMIAAEQATTGIMTHALHYGSAVFEGIRAYDSDHGPVIFKLQQHIRRFFYSAEKLGMEIPYSEAEVCQACIDTVQANGLRACYIRPLVYYGQGPLKVVPTTEHPVDLIIACWPWGNYLPVEAVDVAISPYIRIHPRSTVADAKISGHYVNSILSGLALRNTHYHEALLLDVDGYVAEGSAENIFIVKHNKMVTTPAGTILLGITRDTVMQIAAQLGIAVEQRSFKPEEVMAADEAFFCGTAVEVTAIRSLDDHLINHGKIGPITQQIKQAYQAIVHGRDPNFQSALTPVPKLQEVV